MIYSALSISQNKVVATFDSSKHTKEEFEKFKKKYPAKDGFCIASHTEIKEQ